MKKFLFPAAIAALALSSCSSDEVVNSVKGEEVSSLPVMFTSYLARDTRTTNLTSTASIQAPDAGFGVYAYEHGTQKVEDYTKSFVTLNFFDNQQVTYSGGEWGYNPVKYWPNNTDAKVSFYAYAPYIDGLHSGNASAPDNPVLVLRGENNGPALYYEMPTDLTLGIDLCYGVLEGTDKAPVNLTKPAVNDKVKFTFKHTLARYGFNVQVFNDIVTDGNEHGTPADGGAITTNTTIDIKSLKLVGNMATSGTLRLYDGKWDAQVATSESYELNGGFNPAVGNIKVSDAATEIDLFKDADDYVLLIPESKFRIQIAYDVITDDANLLNGKSVTENVITSDEVFTAKAGVATDFHLNLGMTTVKFDAEVTTWNTPNVTEVDLPDNYNNVITVPFTTLAATEYGNTASKPVTSTVGDVYLDTETLEYLVSDGTTFDKDNSVNGIFSTAGGFYQVTAGVAVMLPVYTNVTDVEDLKTSPAGYYLIGTTLYKVG